MTGLTALWLCNSGVEKSETFLEQSLATLQEMGDVVAICGAPALGEPNPDVHYGRFAARTLRVYHIVIRKMTGRDVRLSAQRSRCQREVDDALGRAQPDFVWVEFATTAWLAKTTLEEMGVPYFLNVHGYDLNRAFASEEYKKGFVRLANRSAGVICALHHTRMLCQSAGVRMDRLHMVRLAIDASRFPQPLNKTDQPSFVHFGRLTGKKGPLITLEVLAMVQRQYSNAVMTFIGSGPLESELRRRVVRLWLENSVRLVPAQRWQDGLREVSRHWVFC